MKSLQALTRHIDLWWRQRFTEVQPAKLRRRSPITQIATVVANVPSANLSHPETTPGKPPGSASLPSGKRRGQWGRDGLSSTALFCLVVVSLSTSVSYRFYDKPKLDVDTIAPETLRAPDAASVEDVQATAAKRQAARARLVPVLKIDQQTSQQIYRELHRFFEVSHRLREQAGPFPYVEPQILATGLQSYLRRASQEEWQAMLKDSTVPGEPGHSQEPTTAAAEEGDRPSSRPETTARSRQQQAAIAALQAYQQQVPTAEFAALIQRIMQARQQYAEALTSMPESTASGQRLPYLTSLDLRTEDWQRARSAVLVTATRMLSQGIPKGLPPEVVRTAVQVQVKDQIPTATEPLVTDVLATILQPNLVQDPERTRQQTEQATQSVSPAMIRVQKDDVIVRAGEQISPQQFALLDHFDLSRRGIDWVSIMGLTALTGGAIGVFLLVERRVHLDLRRRDYLLMLLLTLTSPLLTVLRIPYVSLPAIGLLVGSFYGSVLGVTVVGLLAVLLPVGLEIGWSQLLPSIVGGLLGGAIAGRLRSREELALLGGVVGLSQGAVKLLIGLLLSPAAPIVWYALLSAAGLEVLIGIAWSIVALGLSPYLEHVFDLVTPIRLAELSNCNRPLLKRLASETPGTFQHTLFVASLAEAAAQKLGCNVELVRAGTLYHDIGKMHDPLAFIENQMGGPNKHDALNDPWKSAEIIKKHVSQGLVMAQKWRLPTAIRAFIPEHQGTMLISFFYHQAQQRAQHDPTLKVHEADFRYEGPIPQSRETGIVMLADSCEAALRSLKEATPEEALAMVNKILRARWQDNQLIDAGLSRGEMSLIAGVFVRVWQQFHHKRIPYPTPIPLAPCQQLALETTGSIGGHDVALHKQKE